MPAQDGIPEATGTPGPSGIIKLNENLFILVNLSFPLSLSLFGTGIERELPRYPETETLVQIWALLRCEKTRFLLLLRNVTVAEWGVIS